MLSKNLIFLYIVIAIFVLPSCEKRMDYKAMQIVQEMPLQQKIGQILMISIPDKKITNDSISIITKYMPGGIILFGYNLGNTEEMKNFILDMQKTAFERYKIPMFISIDQEGGRVKRIRTGVTQFPGNMAFGIVNDKEITYEAARIIGIELRKTGINMNLAPVLDINNNPENPVINTRSFGSDQETVSRLGTAYIKGLQKSRCIAVGKHFPGHGDTDQDSHLTLPVIRYDIERLRRIELSPFAQAIDNGLEAVMTAHISFPDILKDDSSATISKKFLTDILREDLHFKGITITDDMEMNAISKVTDLGEAAVKSIVAGTDIILISTHGNSIDIIAKSIEKAVVDDRITLARIDESVKRIVELKLRYGIMDIKDGKVIIPELIYGNDELEILNMAAELNRRVSRDAIYYYNKNTPFEPITENSSRKIFISSSEFFKKEIEANVNLNNYKSFSSEKEFVKFAEKIIPGDTTQVRLQDTIVYYQFDKTDPVSIDRINNLIQGSGAKLFLICTGNPFPLGKVKNIPPTLISFSNTDESIMQMIACLIGEFKPKEKISLHLGFPDK